MSIHISKTATARRFPAGDVASIKDLDRDDIAALHAGRTVIVTGCAPAGGRYGETFRRVVRKRSQFLLRRVPRNERDNVARMLEGVTK